MYGQGLMAPVTDRAEGSRGRCPALRRPVVLMRRLPSPHEDALVHARHHRGPSEFVVDTVP